jgi:hypothetical protein
VGTVWLLLTCSDPHLLYAIVGTAPVGYTIVGYVIVGYTIVGYGLRHRGLRHRGLRRPCLCCYVARSFDVGTQTAASSARRTTRWSPRLRSWWTRPPTCRSVGDHFLDCSRQLSSTQKRANILLFGVWDNDPRVTSLRLVQFEIPLFALGCIVGKCSNVERARFRFFDCSFAAESLVLRAPPLLPPDRARTSKTKHPLEYFASHHVVGPMQIDTWNREKMNLTKGGPFVAGMYNVTSTQARFYGGLIAAMPFKPLVHLIFLWRDCDTYLGGICFSCVIHRCVMYYATMMCVESRASWPSVEPCCIGCGCRKAT